MPIARPARRAIVALSVAGAIAGGSLIASAVAGASPGSHGAVASSQAVASAPVTGAAAAKAMNAQHMVLPTAPMQPTARTQAKPGGTAYAQSWAGYVTSGPKFRYIQADIVVPTANCRKTSNGWAYEWIGLDGTIPSHPTVEQDGVAAECYHGRAYYAPWYETFPKLPVFTNDAIFPGNHVRVTVYYDKANHLYNFTLVNLSNGEGFNTWQHCASSPCRNATAEVITESPCKNSSCTLFINLADYQVVHYSNVIITDQAGQRGGIISSHWGATKTIMVDLAGRMKTNTSGLGRGSAFSTRWTASS